MKRRQSRPISHLFWAVAAEQGGEEEAFWPRFVVISVRELLHKREKSHFSCGKTRRMFENGKERVNKQIGEFLRAKNGVFVPFLKKNDAFAAEL